VHEYSCCRRFLVESIVFCAFCGDFFQSIDMVLVLKKVSLPQHMDPDTSSLKGAPDGVFCLQSRT
jgi:hypothetical protein